ncbi:spore protease YyaC [Paenibacillus sp. LHD-38]|uniref:spore protease YyaC n=1 Tax=Paenibacillus sp. LHD-38 TaxID=3072143 RepID=UPI00280FF2C0|nr:spore protease YyaC [Paenibacillus sp. LHD-38]MDQ8738503.1 spore protease YyaC [Paenibacillus sp. LHD-38]
MDLFLEAVANKHQDRSRIAFVCIGSDRSTGDSFGPLAGSLLKDRGWPNVIGTLQQPCDAHAVEHAALEIPKECTIIAIDACLGKPGSIGRCLVSEGPLQPGKAIGRRLPAIGDYSIAGVVNANGPKAYWMLQTTSLYQVMRMANEVVNAIEAAWSSYIDDATSVNPELQIPVL